MRPKYNSIGEEYELHGMFFGFILGLVVAVALRPTPTIQYTPAEVEATEQFRPR